MSKQFETYKDIEKMLEQIKVTEPDFVSLAMPKRYVAPASYPHFGKVFVTSAYQNNFLLSMGFDVNPTVNAGYTVFAKLTKYQVPTYYVTENLCEALAVTSPPADMLLDDIKWPMPAMVFMLPIDFCHRFFGRQVNFISAARFEANEIVESPGMTALGKMQSVELVSASPQVILYYESVEPESNLVSNYNSNSPVTRKIGEIVHDDVVYNGEIIDPAQQPFNPKEDKEFANRVFMFVIKLLLVMTARQSYVEAGECVRTEKWKKSGKVRDALWAPNYIGRTYKVQREGTTPTGTHASPRLHWRRGHIRHQPYGEGRSLMRVIWIEPCLIGAKVEKQE